MIKFYLFSDRVYLHPCKKGVSGTKKPGSYRERVRPGLAPARLLGLHEIGPPCYIPLHVIPLLHIVTYS